jgi:hypothetical protein
MALDSNLIGRVYHRETDVVDAINQSIVRDILSALAKVIQAEAGRISDKFSPTEVDPFSRDALQSLLISQIASFLTFDDCDQMEIIQPHQLTNPAYAEFFFEVTS